MTVEQLHEILDDENKKITISELEQVIYELRNDVLEQSNKIYSRMCHFQPDSKQYRKLLKDYSYYIGEHNAFQVCLDLLVHLE